MGDKEHLQTILLELVQEFNSSINAFLNYPKIHHAVRTGEFATETSTRKSYSTATGITINFSFMAQCIGSFIYDFESSKNLFDFLKSKNYIIENYQHHEFKTYSEMRNIIPTLLDRIAGGFIARNFELNKFAIKITSESFKAAFDELWEFFSKDDVEITSYVNIMGLQGDVDTIVCNPNVSISKANFQTAKEFSLNFSSSTNFMFSTIDMFQGDYILIFKQTIPKLFYKHTSKPSAHNFIQQQKRKWFFLPVLGITGRLQIGSVITKTNDWAMALHGPSAWSHEAHHFNSHDKNIAKVDREIIENLLAVAQVIGDTNFEALDSKILLSIERLENSKKAFRTDDRVIELALALEYIIPLTEKFEVSLRLRILSIKLLNEDGNEDHIYKTVTNFYALRSTVVHGNSTVEESIANMTIIENTEMIIQRLILRMLKLTNKYTYSEVKEVLSKGFYTSKTLDEMLVEHKKG